MAHAARDGVSLSALSAMLGRNAAYLQQYVKRGTPRALADADRQALAQFFGVPETAFGDPRPSDGPVRVPRLDIGASAGAGRFVDGEILLGSDAFDPSLLRRLGLTTGAGAVLRVRGDSMEPGLMDGDQILVDTADRRPRAGVYVIRIDDLVMVKRVALVGGRVTVSSDNPLAPPLPGGPPTILGRVVWQMRATR